MISLDDRIRQLLDKHKIVGLAASVIHEGQKIWSGGYGWANIARRIPVTDHTVFRIASISKTVVATAIMQLVEKGLCGIDQDVGEILGFPVRSPKYPNIPITIKHIMTHTSGLQDEYVRFVVDSRSENPPKIRLADILMPDGPYYTDSLWGDGQPGDPDSFEYSNLGAVILAAIVEKLSNERFDEYCRMHLFEPLGMNESSFNIGDFEDMDSIAVLYEYSEADNRFIVGTDDFGGRKPDPIDYSGYVPGTNGALFSPQGGLRTTVHDLTRFLEAHVKAGELGGIRILKPETADLMHTAHWSGHRRDGFFRNSGLQFQITDDLIPGYRLIGHAGDAYGLLSDMYFHKQEKWGLILVMNGLYQRKGQSVYFEAEEELAHLLHFNFLK
ncbi:serine hydrolase domain-containing protein [Paenibacillus sp. GP183]|uniref:serine hydrolase domain-containing protein n=1 Tax=Paenibacillus sp. GP183 TaxID=1882751 RepID=UPI00089A70A1|nr:serine hydrolase domain-containing protein [Paenibacillus sp. GP183]SEB52525.1 CubicO group peptidase, beta-lactamase class C family [Paenibacillus sp. GP183]